MSYINGVFKHVRTSRVITENPCEYVETRNFLKFYDRTRATIEYDRITKEYIVESTKTGKERQFPLSEKALSILRKVKKVELQYGFLGEYVFQNENGKLHSSAIAHCIRYKCI